MYFAALATHKFLPAYITENLLKVISSNFVCEGNRSEYISYGLNSIREISQNNPDAMTKDMLASLIYFFKLKDKSD